MWQGKQIFSGSTSMRFTWHEHTSMYPLKLLNLFSSFARFSEHYNHVVIFFSIMYCLCIFFVLSSYFLFPQVLIPYCKISLVSGKSHHVLYALNKYNATFDVLDSFPYAKGVRPSRSKFHSETVEIVSTVIVLSAHPCTSYNFFLYFQFIHFCTTWFSADNLYIFCLILVLPNFLLCTS